MANPIAYQILDALKTRLEDILVANGYNTDAGNQVHLGQRQANPDELDTGPVLFVYDTADELDPETRCTDENLHITLLVTVEVLMKLGSSDDTLLMHQLVQDVKDAMLDPTDLTLGGLALDVGYSSRTVEYPDSGGDTVAASLEFTLLYLEPYGAP